MRRLTHRQIIVFLFTMSIFALVMARFAFRIFCSLIHPTRALSAAQDSDARRCRRLHRSSAVVVFSGTSTTPDCSWPVGSRAQAQRLLRRFDRRIHIDIAS